MKFIINLKRFKKHLVEENNLKFAIIGRFLKFWQSRMEIAHAHSWNNFIKILIPHKKFCRCFEFKKHPQTGDEIDCKKNIARTQGRYLQTHTQNFQEFASRVCWMQFFSISNGTLYLNILNRICYLKQFYCL